LEGENADARSDIFALGAILYEMSIGKRAFEGKTMASVIAAILEGQPIAPSQVQPTSPLVMDQLVKQCLAKDPAERMQSAHDVKLQLENMAEVRSETRTKTEKNFWRTAVWAMGGFAWVLQLPLVYRFERALLCPSRWLACRSCLRRKHRSRNTILLFRRMARGSRSWQPAVTVGTRSGFEYSPGGTHNQ
jgi:serine/threonine protein kinase